MKTLSDKDIADIEAGRGISLPVFYCELLKRSGYGTFSGSDKNAWNDQKEIHHPSEILPLYESFLDDPSILLTRFVPIGVDNRTQEIWVVDLTRNQIASIAHDVHPDAWFDDEEEWLEYDIWAREHLAE